MTGDFRVVLAFVCAVVGGQALGCVGPVDPEPAAGTATAAAPTDPEPTPEATSLAGEPLPRLSLPDDFRTEQQALLADAEAALAAAPDDPDALVWVGRRQGYLGRYNDAVASFTRGVEQFPADARFLRHRGHRLISLRRLDEAVADLVRGTELVADRPDEIEPDGLPNAQNIPTSSLQTNLWYHLGLAYYLQGRHAESADAFGRCQDLSTNADMRVAAAFWRYLASARAGDLARAAEILRPITADLALIENRDYHQLLLLFRGELDAEALLAAHEPGSLGFATVANGIGQWHLVHGRTDDARALFERIVATEGWSAFGYIAAEAELARR